MGNLILTENKASANPFPRRYFAQNRVQEQTEGAGLRP